MAVLRQSVTLDQHLGQAAARALGEERVLAAQLHAAREAPFGMAVLRQSHITSGDTRDCAAFKQQLGRGETWIDFHPQRLGLSRQIAANFAERDDEVAVIAHERRHQHVRQPQRSGRSEGVEAVGGNGSLDRRVFAAPFGNQAIETDRIDHGAGKDMGAHFGALLHHDHRFFRSELLEADGGGQPRRPRPDDNNVEFHSLPGRKLGCTHGLLRVPATEDDFSRIRRADNRPIPHTIAPLQSPDDNRPISAGRNRVRGRARPAGAAHPPCGSSECFTPASARVDLPLAAPKCL